MKWIRRSLMWCLLTAVGLTYTAGCLWVDDDDYHHHHYHHEWHDRDRDRW